MKNFFNKFEKELALKNENALNFFFSDELNFFISRNLGDKDFAAEFKKRKGNDAGIKLSPPFKFNIKKFVKEGSNKSNSPRRPERSEGSPECGTIVNIMKDINHPILNLVY